MKKKKNNYSKILMILILFCILIFSGADGGCSIKDNIIKQDPDTLNKQSAVNAVMGFVDIMAGAAATITIIFIVIGGIMYITSAGNQEQATKAKSTLTWAIIGFILIVTSYSIITFFVNFVQGK